MYKRQDTGSTKVEESATVIHQITDTDGYHKLICVFNENRLNEDLLLEYVYNRQMNIISEMRELFN